MLVCVGMQDARLRQLFTLLGSCRCEWKGAGLVRHFRFRSRTVTTFFFSVYFVN